MGYKLIKNPNSNCNFSIFTIFTFVIITMILVYNYQSNTLKLEKFTNKKKDKKDKKQKKQKKDKSYNLGVCSKNCCTTQWPVPIDLTEDSNVKLNEVGTKYFTTNMTCNNGVTNTGCVCLTDKSKKFLAKGGFEKDFPTGNGLFEQDNRISAFKIMEDKTPRPVNVLGQTTELTGSPKDKYIVKGKDEYKFEDRINSHRSIESDGEIAGKYSLPINNNIIEWDNGGINKSLINTNISGNFFDEVPPISTKSLLKSSVGYPTSDISVSRFQN